MREYVCREKVDDQGDVVAATDYSCQVEGPTGRCPDSPTQAAMSMLRNCRSMYRADY
jgi:hypothetical protein